MIDLITRLKNKDQKAFQELYNNYSESLLSKISRMTGDNLNNDDILQNAFLKVWTCIDRFDDNKASLYTWMTRICHNEVMDYFRLKNCTKRKLTSNYIRVTDVHYSVSPGNRVDVDRIRAKLKQSDRMIVDLIYMHGYSYSQTSEILSVPVGSLKTKVRKLLFKWREPVAIP